MDKPKPFILREKDGRVMLRFEGEEELRPVQVVRMRPLSVEDRWFSFIDPDKKEIAALELLSEFDSDSRLIAEKALERRYLETEISAVIKTSTESGTRFWEVITPRGKATFALRQLNKNVRYLTDDHICIKDTLGNQWRIHSLAALDEKSRREVARVL